MKKLTLFFSSILGGISGLFAQDYWPTIEVPDSLNPFLTYPESRVEIADFDDDGIDDILFYHDNNLNFSHLKGLGNGQFEQISSTQSILNDPITAALNYFPDSINWADEVDNFACSFADIDNDGDLDLIISGDLSQFVTGKYSAIQCYTPYDESFEKNYLVFEKVGNGSFDTENIDLNPFNPYCSSRDAAFVDFDNDGDQDLIQSKVVGGENGKYVNSTTFFNEYDEIDAVFQLTNTVNFFAYSYDYLELSAFIRVHDINHDGFDDLWEGNYIRLGNGNNSSDIMMNFQEKILIESANMPSANLGVFYEQKRYKTDLGDFDGDGLSEWLIFDDGGWRLFTQKCSSENANHSCIDFNNCTNEEAFNENCQCLSEDLGDADMDGICDSIDLTNGDCELNYPCDDGLICTTNDSLDENCNCIGEELPDSDADGVCNALDQCPGQNDLQDYNMNNIPDCLEIQSDADFEDNGIGPAPNVSNKKSLIADEVKIFPNPSDGIFTIDSKLKIQHLKLFNAIGEEVPVFISGQNQIDISSFSKGIYFIEIKTEEGILRKKLIKE